MTPPPAVLFARLMAGARLRHLQAFASIAELGSTKRAADSIGISQPAMTLLIANLEESLECTLFLRHARGMRLTDIGRELLPFVRRAMTSLEGATELVAFRSVSARTIVRVGAIHGAISGLLVRALPAFNRMKPDIVVALQEANIAQTSALIANSELDLMLCREPGTLPAGWEFVELMPDQLVVVAGPHHPLVRRRRLSFANVLDEPWLRYPVGTQANRFLDELMVQHNHGANYGGVTTSSPAMMLALLPGERLISLAPRSVVRQHIDLGLLAVLDVVDLPVLQPLGVLSPREDLGDAASALKTHLRRFAEQQP